MRRNILSCGNKSGEATRWLAQRRLAGHSDVPFCAEACSFNRHAVDPRARTLGAWVMGKLRERAGPMSEDARESRLQSLWTIIEGKLGAETKTGGAGKEHSQPSTFVKKMQSVKHWVLDGGRHAVIGRQAGQIGLLGSKTVMP